MKDLHRLFINQLERIYDGERQIVKALPHAIRAASSPELKQALRDHLEETKKQVRRLEVIFRELRLPISKVSSQGMKQLLKEVNEVIRSDYKMFVKDSALINCLQHIEHFEIASYGTLKALAKGFKYSAIHNLLEESAKEEGHANKKLTDIAKGSIFTKGINEKAKEKSLKRSAA